MKTLAPDLINQLNTTFLSIFDEEQINGEVDWRKIITAAKTIYIHPVLEENLSILNVCLPYLSSWVEYLSEDQLSEIVEVIDLLIGQDQSLVEWLQFQEKNELARLPKINNLEIILRQVFSVLLDECAYTSPSQIPSLDLVRTVGYLEILRDEEGEPIILQGAEHLLQFIVGRISSHLREAIPQYWDCLIAVDNTWSEEDVLDLHTLSYGIPSFILGRFLDVRHDKLRWELELSSAKSDFGLLVYAIVKPEEVFRKQQIILEHQLDHIIWKSKQGVLTDYNQSLLEFSTISNKNDVEGLLRNNAKAFTELLDDVSKLTSLNDLQNYLTRFFGEATQSCFLPHPLKALDILCSWPMRTHKLNPQNLCVILLNMFHKLSLIYETPYLFGKRVRLSLLNTKHNSLVDVGNALFIQIVEPEKVFTIDPYSQFDSNYLEIASRDVTLYTRITTNHSYKPEERLEKYIDHVSQLPTIAGVKWGNPLSSLAIATVGIVGTELEERFLDSIAAFIELDDRPSRTGNLPDPWEYNILKMCQVLSNNYNIRYLALIGRLDNCPTTVRKIGSIAALHNFDFNDTNYLNEDVIMILLDNLKWIGRHNTEDPNWRVARKTFQIISTWVKRTFIEGSNDFPREITGAQRILRNTQLFRSDERLEFDDLLDRYINLYNRSHIERIDPTGIICSTFGRFKAPLLATILKYGELKGPDSLGRYYRELLSSRVVIIEATKDVDLTGTDRDAVQQYFINEWINAGGMFNDRFRSYFDGFDQVENVINRIAGTIARDGITRSIIMDVHHPAKDQESPLGLNVVYFSLRRSTSRIYEVIGTFIWRSAEALFSMPFTLYAIAQFQKWIVEQCRIRLGPTYEVRMGETIFVGLNLHVYIDDLNLAVARKIILSGLE